MCTYLNRYSKVKCQMCSHVRPVSTSTSTSASAPGRNTRQAQGKTQTPGTAMPAALTRTSLPVARSLVSGVARQPARPILKLKALPAKAAEPVLDANDQANFPPLGGVIGIDQSEVREDAPQDTEDVEGDGDGKDGKDGVPEKKMTEDEGMEKADIVGTGDGGALKSRAEVAPVGLNPNAAVFTFAPAANDTPVPSPMGARTNDNITAGPESNANTGFTDSNALPPSSSMSPTPTAGKVQTNRIDDDYYHYWYQTSNGQLLYLHPLNFRMLMYEFKSVHAFPRNIIGRLIDLEDHTMNESSQRKYSFLRHLPLTSVFQIGLLDFSLPPAGSDPVLSADTLQAFQYEFSQLRTSIMKSKKAILDRSRRDSRKAAKLSLRDDYGRTISTGPSFDLDLNATGQHSFPTLASTSPTHNPLGFSSGLPEPTHAQTEAGTEGKAGNNSNSSSNSNSNSSSTGGGGGGGGGWSQVAEKGFANPLWAPLTSESQSSSPPSLSLASSSSSVSVPTPASTSAETVTAPPSWGAIRNAANAAKKGKKSKTLLFSTGGGRRY